MTLSDPTAEAYRIQLDIFRRTGPQGRLKRAVELPETSRQLLAQGVRRQHPHYSDEEVHLAGIRLQLPDELFLKAYPHAVHLRP